MTVLTVFSPTGDGRVLSWDPTLANARAGTGTTFSSSTVDTSVMVGQQLNAGLYKIEHGYFQWDTSPIPDSATISAAVISLWSAADLYVDTGFVSEIRLYDWGAALTTADWVPAASLSGLTRLGTYSVGTGESSGVYRNYTNDGTNLIDNINKTGFTSVVVSSDRVAAGNTPTNREFFQVAMADTTGTANDPKLVVTYTATTDYTLTAPQGSFTETGETAPLVKALHLTAGVGTFGIPTFGGLPMDSAHMKVGRLSSTRSFTLTGEDASLHAIRHLVADEGSFSVDGQDATFAAHDHVLSASTGIYTLDGQDAVLQSVRTFVVDGAIYTLTGHDANLVYGHRLQAIRTVFFLDGEDAELTYTFNGHDFTVRADSGSFNLTGQDADLFRTPRPIVFPPAGGGSGGAGGFGGLFQRAGIRARTPQIIRWYGVNGGTGLLTTVGGAAELTVTRVGEPPVTATEPVTRAIPPALPRRWPRHYQMRVAMGVVGMDTGSARLGLWRATAMIDAPVPAVAPLEVASPIPANATGDMGSVATTVHSTATPWNEDEDLRLLFGVGWGELEPGDTVEDLILLGT